jgi:hypothetical protein
MQVLNSIVYHNGNSNSIDLNQLYDSAYVSHSIIEGGLAAFGDSINQAKVDWSLGNFNMNPIFSDTSTLELHPMSPAIGGANPIYSSNIDVYGNPRPNPFGSIPDIGAVESPEATPMCPIFNQPLNVFVDLSQQDSAIFDVGYVSPYTTYQWQFNAGLGWLNLNSNSGNYAGGKNHQLNLMNIQSSFNGFAFRCIISNPMCSDTSSTAYLAVVGFNVQSSQPLTIEGAIEQFLDESLAVTKQDNYKVRPNPTLGKFSIEPFEEGNYSIVDSQGRVVETGKCRESYDLSKYPSGIYIIRLTLENEVHQLRVIKQ